MVKKIISNKCLQKNKSLFKKRKSLYNALKKVGLAIIHKQLEEDRIYKKKYLENLKYIERLKKLQFQINKLHNAVLDKINTENDNILVDMFKNL